MTALSLLAIAATLVATPNARVKVEMLPPEIAQQFSPSWLGGFGEPPLWTANAGNGYRTRLRLTIAGIVMAKVAIRVDEREDGRLTGRFVYISSHRKWGPIGRSVRRFPITPSQMQELRGLITAAHLWSIYPEFYSHADSDSICIDGMELIFERVDAAGYRFSNANAQCNAPRAMIAVAAKLIEISGATRARGWLR